MLQLSQIYFRGRPDMTLNNLSPFLEPEACSLSIHTVTEDFKSLEFKFGGIVLFQTAKTSPVKPWQIQHQQPWTPHFSIKWKNCWTEN